MTVAGNTQRERVDSRAATHRLDEPHQVIPQHGCIPAVADQTGGLDNEERNYMVYADDAWCVGS
jgi:hypothetical protein